MAFQIGFHAALPEEKHEEAAGAVLPKAAEPRRSVVAVRFPARNMTLSYYNDRFDLHRGDLVYVEGKLEGLLGRVTEVHYNFKIKLSDYKRVIAVVDTNVHGRLYQAGSHFVCFERSTLPAAQAVRWFKAPEKEGDEVVSGGDDDTAFLLDDLKTMPIAAAVAERGHSYYMENRVRYLCLDGTRGYAVVEGSESYEVEFTCRNGEISRPVCSCFCSGSCKHEFAALLQLREVLELVEKHYADEYARTGYLAAIAKGSLFAFAVDGKESGSILL